MKKSKITMRDFYDTFILFILLSVYGILLEKVKFVDRKSPDISSAVEIVVIFLSVVVFVFIFKLILDKFIVYKHENIENKNITIENILQILIQMNYSIVSFSDNIIIYEYGSGLKCQGFIKFNEGMMCLYDQSKNIDILKKRIAMK